jgi:isoleucyl-tRNA synthetase
MPAMEGREASVHLALFPAPVEIFSGDRTELFEEWKVLLAVRDEVLRELEEDRQKKLIGKSLEARVHIIANSGLCDLLRRYYSSLKEMLNVSQVEVVSTYVESISPTMNRVGFVQDRRINIVVGPAAGHKCARCWNFMPEVSNYGIWQNICTRCQNALKEMKIAPPKEAQ